MKTFLAKFQGKNWFDMIRCLQTQNTLEDQERNIDTHFEDDTFEWPRRNFILTRCEVMNKACGTKSTVGYPIIKIRHPVSEITCCKDSISQNRWGRLLWSVQVVLIRCLLLSSITPFCWVWGQEVLWRILWTAIIG